MPPDLALESQAAPDTGGPPALPSETPAAPQSTETSEPPALFEKSEAHTIWPLPVIEPPTPTLRVRITEKAPNWRGREGSVQCDPAILQAEADRQISESEEAFVKRRIAEGKPYLQESLLVELGGGMTCYQKAEHLEIIKS